MPHMELMGLRTRLSGAEMERDALRAEMDLTRSERDALRRMIDLTLAGRPFPLYGDGSVSRSFTYVADVVDANLAALFHPAPSGTVVNVANESTASMRDLIELVGAAVGTPVQIEHHEAAAGDAQRTGGSSDHARAVLGWSPTTSSVAASTTVTMNHWPSTGCPSIARTSVTIPSARSRA